MGLIRILLLYLFLAYRTQVEAVSLPSELLLRPWWKGGEISGFGISQTGSLSSYGGILQVPVHGFGEERFRVFILGSFPGQGERRNPIFGFGYRSPLFFSRIGFQIQAGGLLGNTGDLHAGFGVYAGERSFEFFVRKNLEEGSQGAILRSGQISELQVSVSYERIQRFGEGEEEKISFGLTWQLSGFCGEVRLKEEEGEPLGLISFGYGPFFSEPIPPERKVRIEKPELPQPNVSEDELLSLGFSLGEALRISSGSLKGREEFEKILASLSEEKRKKIRRLLWKKARTNP